MKTKAPQFELPQAEEVFNLAGQTTKDGARLARERDQAKRQTAEVAKQAACTQTEFFPCTLPASVA